MQNRGQEKTPFDGAEAQFSIEQYRALRDEIIHLRKVIVNILSIGITGIPVLIGASLKFEMDPVLYVSPLIVVVFIFMLLFEQNSLMRAGRFIRSHIEPKFDSFGWESFLEQPTSDEPDRRTAEKLFALASHMIFGIYYLGATYLAFKRISATGYVEIAYLSVVIYLSTFSFVLWFVIKNLPVRTTMSWEKRPRSPEKGAEIE